MPFVFIQNKIHIKLYKILMLISVHIQITTRIFPILHSLIYLAKNIITITLVSMDTLRLNVAYKVAF